MKKLIFIFIAGIFSGSAFAQGYGSSLSIGGLGGYRSTWLLNQNVQDDNSASQEMEAAFGPTYGATLSIYFTKNIGIGAGVQYAKLNQKYNGITDQLTNTPYESENSLTRLNIPLYLRVSTNGGAYFEFGAQYSAILNADYTVDSDIPLFDNPQGSRSVSEEFANSDLSALIGLGLDIELVENLILNPGLRVTYGLKDIEGVDGRGRDIDAAFNDPKDTRSLTGGILIGLVYRIDM